MRGESGASREVLRDDGGPRCGKWAGGSGASSRQDRPDGSTNLIMTPTTPQIHSTDGSSCMLREARPPIYSLLECGDLAPLWPQPSPYSSSPPALSLVPKLLLGNARHRSS